MQAGCRGRAALRGGRMRTERGVVRLDTVVDWVRSLERGAQEREVGLSPSVQKFVKMVGSMEMLATDAGM